MLAFAPPWQRCLTLNREQTRVVLGSCSVAQRGRQTKKELEENP